MHRVLIVGTGSIGERHLRCFLRTRRVKAGIVEIQDELRARVAEQYGITQAYTRLDEALTASWDAAVIAVPAHLHIPIASQLADRCMALLIEKPLSTTTDGIDDLIHKVRAQGVVVSVAYVLRMYDLFRRLREKYLSNQFGTLLQIMLTGGQNFPYYRPAYHDTYYARRNTGGGALQDAMTHYLNLCEWIAGPITRIVADGRHQRLEEVDVEDTIHVLARHGQVMASYAMNQYQTHSELTLSLICEGGIIRGDLHLNRLSWTDSVEGPWHIQQLPSQERDVWFIRQAEAFLDAVERKSPPVCPLTEGYQTLKATLAALRCLDDDDTLLPIKADAPRQRPS